MLLPANPSRYLKMLFLELEKQQKLYKELSISDLQRLREST